MNATEQKKASERADRWAKAEFERLSRSQRGELQDAFVLDTFDWQDWFDRKPPMWGTNRLSRLIQDDE